jgi:hypothetical protein
MKVSSLSIVIKTKVGRQSALTDGSSEEQEANSVMFYQTTNGREGTVNSLWPCNQSLLAHLMRKSSLRGHSKGFHQHLMVVLLDEPVSSDSMETKAKIQS